MSVGVGLCEVVILDLIQNLFLEGGCGVDGMLKQVQHDEGGKAEGVPYDAGMLKQVRQDGVGKGGECAV